MRINRTKWESLSDSNVYDTFEHPWDCDLFSVLAHQANKEIDSIGREQLSEHIGDHILKFKEYKITTAELFTNDITECFDKYLKGFNIKLSDISIKESEKEIPDAVVNISTSGTDHEIYVSSAFLYYLNYSFQIYRFLGKPTATSDVSHLNSIEMVSESILNLEQIETSAIDKHFILAHLNNLKKFFSPDPTKKLDIINLPSQVIETPILIMYARHFMLMHEISHLLLNKKIAKLDLYLQELLVDEFAIRIMLDGIAANENYDDIKKTTEIQFMLEGILTFLHCQSMHYRFFDHQDQKINSLPYMPNPIIREMAVIRTFYLKGYFEPGSFLPCELLKTIFELNSVTFEPEYFLLTEKERKVPPFITAGGYYILKLYGMNDENIQNIIPTIEKLKTNLFDIFAPDHSAGKLVLNNFLEIYLSILKSAYQTGYFFNRGGRFYNLKEELHVYAYRFFEVRSEHMPIDDRKEFLHYYKNKIDIILDINY